MSDSPPLLGAIPLTRVTPRRPAGARHGAGPWVLAAAALLAGGLFAAAVTAVGAAPGGRLPVLLVDNLGQLAAPTLAGLAGLAAARRSRGGRATAWWLLSAGVGSWAAGQAIWTWHEVVLGREVPFPSAADAGFLAFPLLATAGLLAWLHAGGQATARVRDLLDGSIIAGALLVLSWQTSLGAAGAAGGSDPLALGLSLAYPIGDVVLGTLVLLTLARAAAAERARLAVLGAGLGGLALADSAYVFLVAEGNYATGNLISTGWVTGFLLIAAAAASSPGPDQPLAVERPSWLRLILPYLPLAPAVAVLADEPMHGRVVPPQQVALALLLVGLVLLRQFIVLADHHRLMGQLRRREAELAHRATHDPLTGVANRSLFVERLGQVLAGHHRDGRAVAVAFCDVDDFKAINDVWGHAAGDALLVEVAERLQGNVRAVDTTARLGGDEFAVLLEEPHEDPAVIARRLVRVLGEPVILAGEPVPSGVSVGMAVVPARTGAPRSEPVVSADTVLAAADRAMYAAKTAGKGTAVVERLADAGGWPALPPPSAAGPAGR